ncbi:MAG: SDR family NAD(P)-dependent oxidoreductase [Cyclobacteriaceae bacterium]
MKIKDFKGKVCWITGASSGIGSALATALNGLGAYMIITARTAENLVRVKNNCKYPDNVFILPADLEKIHALHEISMQAWNARHRIDYVFLNAGMAARDFVIDTDFEIIKKVMTINFFGAVSITQSLLPLMKRQGSGFFVVTSSLSGKYGIPKLAAYSASKHALHGFFESLRAEHHKDGIKVTLVIPGLVKTNISVHALNGDGTLSGRMQESIETGISAEQCARQMILSVAQEKKEALIGGPEIHSVLLKRIFPGLFAFAIRSNPLAKLRALGFFKNLPRKN